MFVDLPVDQIDANPGQPRKVFDEEPLAELAESIRQHGLLEPVITRAVEGRYVLIAGERRWRASQRAGVEAIPARVLDIDEEDAFVLSVAENVNRQDMSPLEEASAYAQLVGMGRTTAEIGALFGKRASDIDARIALLGLCSEVQQMLSREQIGVYLAWKVAQLSPGNQRSVAVRWLRGEFASETEATEFANALLAHETQDGFFLLEEPTEEDRAAHARRRRQLRTDLDRVLRSMDLMTAIAGQDPGELAVTLGPEVVTRLAAVEELAKWVGRAAIALRKARAFAVAADVLRVRDLDGGDES